jgi:hypothetical protein
VFAEGRCARLAAVTRTARWREAAAGWREAPVGLVAGAALAALLRGAGPGRLVAGALAGGLVAAWGGRRAAGGTRGEAAAPMSGRAPAEPEAAAPGHSLAHVVERLAPWLTLACLVPALTLAVPPGADMAMHVALARALRAGAAELSPAWPGVAPLAYPRGFSALVALAGGLGLARAGLLLAGASYALFARGAAATFAAAGLRRPWTLAALLLFLAKTPQDTFAWGGTPTVLALALGLHAAALLRAAPGWHPGATATAALLLAGAVAVHPMGAGAGALVATVVAGRHRPRGTIVALAALGAGLALLAGAGPALSPAELQWMASWGRTREALLRGAPWQFPVRIWPALWRALGPPWLVAVGAAALLLAGRRAVRPVALGLGGVLALATLIAGLHAFGLAGLVYPVRLAPLFALATAPVLGAALAGLPARAAGAAAALGLALAVPFHLRWYQGAQPMATPADVQVLACLAARTPPDAVVAGAYGDATQWVPALTGRRVTRPHRHVSLLDETAPGLTALRPTHRLRGERVRYPPAFDGPDPGPEPAGPALCAAGAAALWRLP